MSIWNEIEEEEPEISTERLIEMTRQRARVSHDSVMDALDAQCAAQDAETQHDGKP